MYMRIVKWILGWEFEDWIYLAQERDQLQFLVNSRKFLTR